VGDPDGSNATTSLALRVTGTHKPLHHDKVEIPSRILATIEDNSKQFQALVQMLHRNNACYHRTGT